MTDPRTPLVLVTGLHRQLGAQVCRALVDGPGTVAVHHDVSRLSEGVVVRTQLQLRDGVVTEESAAVELAHGCLSCTLRLDLLPLLRTLARRDDVTRVVLHLDPALEPEHLCWAVADLVLDDEPSGVPETAADWVRIEAVLAVVEPAGWLEDVTGGDDLADRGLAATPDDDRTLAQVGLAQVAFADAVVMAGPPADAWEGVRLDAVLDRLVPGVPRADLRLPVQRLLSAVGPDARRGRVSSAHDPLLAGQPPLGADAGVELVRFAPDRPLHPGRLHDALDVLLDGVVCTRGRLWLASQHDRVLWLESAGQGLRVGDVGPWLATLGDDAWADVDPLRRVAAALRWDPVHGDRHTELVVLTVRQSALAITAALHAAVLTEAEWAAGPEAWNRYPDPFDTFHEDPCEASVPADGAATQGTHREERS
ncbi:ribosome hibernation factor-recruiting GTPase MRF [Geodermatophilus chilensis]|uniref:ribosome hibernation factor-recruiting GTPase MRF n=1 Tax=Geodermatophilus chilensis TaxID=2035835 RepID=UPI000C263558|nr:GTP-binding protein [Geodermatophilus chilensis]